MVFRENTEGAYVGIGGNFKKGTADEVAVQEEIHTRKGVERIMPRRVRLGARARQDARSAWPTSRTSCATATTSGSASSSRWRREYPGDRGVATCSSTR